MSIYENKMWKLLDNGFNKKLSFHVTQGDKFSFVVDSEKLRHFTFFSRNVVVVY